MKRNALSVVLLCGISKVSFSGITNTITGNQPFITPISGVAWQY